MNTGFVPILAADMQEAPAAAPQEQLAGDPAAQDAPQQPQGLLDGLMSNPIFVPMMIVLVLFFWFSSRSQRKRDRERQDMLDSMQPKDRVVTIGGLHGRVVSATAETVTLRIDADKDVKITVNRSAVHHKAGQEQDGA